VAKEIKYEAVISDKKGEPDDQKLYDRVKADAAKKFEVYPSAVANGWVVQEYKRRGGTYSVPKTTKGIQVDNIENLKAELAKAEARLADITKSLAKGGPGSGPHKGGGDGANVLSVRAGDILRTAGKTTISDKMDAHNQLAQDHFIARNKAMESGKEDQAKAHELAGKAHMMAENAWHSFGTGMGGGGEATAMQRTQNAANKTNNAAYLEQ